MSQKSKKKNGPLGDAAPTRNGGVAPAKVRGGSELPPDEFEPRAEGAAVPVWLFILLLVLVYWGMIHLDNYAGGFNSQVFGPYQSYKQLADLQPKSGSEALVAKGEVIYGQLCVACHQSTGMGAPGQYPPLAKSDWVHGPANRIIRIPLDGLTGPIKVLGQDFSNNMPPFRGGPLLDNDENLAAVLTYVRQAWGNKAPPITPEQVKAVRAETASRSSPWTPEELLKIE